MSWSITESTGAGTGSLSPGPHPPQPPCDAFCDPWTEPWNFSDHQYPHPKNGGDLRTCRIELWEGTRRNMCETLARVGLSIRGGSVSDPLIHSFIPSLIRTSHSLVLVLAQEVINS